MEQLNLRYTINNNGSITVSWDTISNVARYHAYMYISGKGIIYNETNLTVTSYTSRPDLDANEFYQVIVVAYGPSSSLASDSARILIPSDFYNNVPLGIPQNIDVVADAVSATISFDKVARATGYDILLNETVYSVASSLGRVSKVINELAPKTSYSYAVRAKNSTKTGEYSDTRTFITPAVSPAAPTGITKTVTQNSVTLNWNPVNTATYYEIVFNGITYNVNGTSKTFTGLYPGREYLFKIRGNNADAQGIYTNEMPVVTAPQTPAGISAVSTDTTITISWNAVSGAANYFVYFMDQEIAVPGTETVTTFSKLTPDTSYTYKLCACSVDGRSLYSAEMTTKTASAVPTAPSVTVTADSATISWAAVPGAVSYDLLFDGTTYRVSGTSKTINGLAPGESYTYQIRSNNKDGSSAYSEPRTITTVQSVPSVPSNIRASATMDSATVSWDKIPGAISYDVLWDQYYLDTVADTFVTRTGFIANRDYVYQVRARNKYGTGRYSAKQTIKTLELTEPLTVPTNVRATATTDSVTVSWDSVKWAERYKILFSGGYYEPTDTTITFTKLIPGRIYNYQVRAMNEDVVSDYSEMMYIQTLSTLPLVVPSGIKSSATVNSATISWKAVPGAASYDLLFNGTTYRVTGTFWTIEGLTPGRSYSYQVRANNENDSSDYSEPEVVNIPPTGFGIPGNIQASATTNSVSVSWNEVAGAVGYDVLINNIFFDSVTGTSMTRTGMVANTVFKYQVRARSFTETSKYSVKQTIKTLVLLPIYSDFK